MDWASCVGQAVTSVSGVVAGYGPNDQKKAVSAAKKAGKEAQKLTEKLYPSWDIKGTKELAQSEGCSTRAEWKRARAAAGKEAYEEAYNEVWDIYVRAKDAEINNMQFQSSQEYLDNQLAMAQAQAASLGAAAQIDMKSASGGCLGVGLFLVGSFGGIVYLVFSLIV